MRKKEKVFGRQRQVSHVSWGQADRIPMYPGARQRFMVSFDDSKELYL